MFLKTAVNPLTVFFPRINIYIKLHDAHFFHNISYMCENKISIKEVYI